MPTPAAQGGDELHHHHGHRAQRGGRGGGRRVSVTKPGAEIHDYQPTPRDVARAQDAGLILWNGMNLERWFERFLGNVEGVANAVVSEGGGTHSHQRGELPGKPNPHAWMSPTNGLLYVENIRKAMAAADPANAALYEQNAKAYSEQIKALDEPLRREIAKIPKTSAGSSPPKAFSYLRAIMR